MLHTDLYRLLSNLKTLNENENRYTMNKDEIEPDFITNMKALSVLQLSMF